MRASILVTLALTAFAVGRPLETTNNVASTSNGVDTAVEQAWQLLVDSGNIESIEDGNFHRRLKAKLKKYKAAAVRSKKAKAAHHPPPPPPPPAAAEEPAPAPSADSSADAPPADAPPADAPVDDSGSS